MKQIITSIILITLLVSFGTAKGQGKIFIGIDGISGSSTISTPDHRKMIAVDAMSNGVSHPSFSGSGTTIPQSLSLQLNNAQDGAALKALFFGPNPAATAYVVFVKDGNGSINKANDYYIIAFANLMPISIQEAGSGGGGGLSVQVSFSFSKATNYFRSTRSDGSLTPSPQFSTWDFVSNSIGTPVLLPANY